MLRVVACASLVAATTLLPIDQPSARAENWQPIGSGLCIDWDTVRQQSGGSLLDAGPQIATWIADYCPSNPLHGKDPISAKVDCSQKARQWTVYFKSKSGEADQVQFQEKTKFINDICFEINGF